MYNIIETDNSANYPDRKNCIISIHIEVDPLLDPSKVELYRYLRDIVEFSNKIQIYLYTQPDKPWIKELDKLMESVFKPHHNISLVLLRDDRPIKEISSFIDFTTGTIISQNFSMISTTNGVLILDSLRASILLGRYKINNDKPLKLELLDHMTYGNTDQYPILGRAICKLISDHISITNSRLNLKILYVEQAEREPIDVNVEQYRTINNNILSKLNNIVYTSTDFYSIFTEYNTIETLIKSINKDKSKDTILIVIDSVDRSSSVNYNNNSYYIPIDSYITHKIVSRIIDIVLNTII